MEREIQNKLTEVVKKLYSIEIEPEVEIPQDLSHGDFTTNIALVLSKQLGKNPREIADEIVKEFIVLGSQFTVEIAGPGFINFRLSNDQLEHNLSQILDEKEEYGRGRTLAGKKIMVEFAHPNTHKEMHIGHMRTLITGEALARIFEAEGAQVFRANYQGDIGPHVAKALYGVQKLLKEQGRTVAEIETWNNIEKAHFLGVGYVRGNQDYEAHKDEIDDINTALYNRDPGIWDLYQKTRQWNLDYYDDFYKRFYTMFDRLFFESEMDEGGKQIVKSHIGDIFEEDAGAIIFRGEKYGLHTRVFISGAGHSLYEAKDMFNALQEYEAFPFDLKMHVVASEQAGYFQVVFKALELLDPEKFKDKQYHLSMGMVQLSDPSAGSGQARKMSSRTGDIVTVDWLLDEVKKRVERIIEKAQVTKETKDEVVEEVTIGAVKYSVLKNGTGQDVAFDIEKSVALDGNSGPYLQYTYARTQSVLGKAVNRDLKFEIRNLKLEIEEDHLLRLLTQFPGVVEEAAEKYSPNLIANYLFELAQSFNHFYQKHKVIGSDEESFRLSLTQAVGIVFKNGLNLLGIQAPQKM